MTYNETLDWMFKQLPMYQKLGKKALNAKLDKIIHFSRHLEYPEKKFKSIHVAGTNGKGSSSHMMASILQEAGYKVGLYTSPHLKDFRERIRINGEKVPEHYVVQFIADNRSFFDQHKLSFFEMTVGMAFEYFSKQKVDIAVIEVGLGGRFDSTNIISPEVSLITNIGLDHTTILGNTLAEIAREKAGIIKEGVPVVISEYQEETAPVFEAVATQKNAKLIYAEEVDMHNYEMALLGSYQAKNGKGVISCLNVLDGFRIGRQEVVQGLKNVISNTGLMGRWQLLSENPMIICDSAHNKEGLDLVLKQIAEKEVEQLHIVLGFVKEKQLATILPLFPKNAKYYFCKPNIDRGLEASILRKEAGDFDLIGERYDSVKKAYIAALANAKTEDFIFVGGSNFVVAEVL